ncbi:MAG: hypothetical protein HY234_03215 [Acidobacteria bacterium]|nr:hypothetical protein [Acidobacteriota bacterium]
MLGRRIQKVTPTETTICVYDGANILEETDASGAVVARYAQGLGIDEPLAMLRGGELEMLRGLPPPAADPSAQEAIFAWVRVACIAFWDVYLKDDAKARSYLASDSLPEFSRRKASLQRK